MAYLTHADLGGQPSCDRVVPEPEGSPFHAAWEARALALTLAMGATGSWNIDASRAARETLPEYARLGYFQTWLQALERLLVARGLAAGDEIESGHMLRPPVRVARVLLAGEVAATLARGSPTQRPADRPARFEIGQRVRTQPDRPDHHTRLPGYARGRVGSIGAIRGVHVYADSNSQGLGEQPEWLYAVVFDAADLWPDSKPATSHRVSIDAWEPYLEPA